MDFSFLCLHCAEIYWLNLITKEVSAPGAWTELSTSTSYPVALWNGINYKIKKSFPPWSWQFSSWSCCFFVFLPVFLLLSFVSRVSWDAQSHAACVRSFCQSPTACGSINRGSGKSASAGPGSGACNQEVPHVPLNEVAEMLYWQPLACSLWFYCLSLFLFGETWEDCSWGERNWTAGAETQKGTLLRYSHTFSTTIAINFCLH